MFLCLNIVCFDPILIDFDYFISILNQQFLKPMLKGLILFHWFLNLFLGIWTVITFGKFLQNHFIYLNGKKNFGGKCFFEMNGVYVYIIKF